MNQKLFIFLLIVILWSAVIHADEAITAGVSPDNALLWRLEILMEDINTAATANQGTKIEKILDHAAERTAELEKMLRWEKTAAAEKAAEKHEKLMSSALEKIQELEHKNTEKEFEAEVHIEEAIGMYLGQMTTIMLSSDANAMGSEGAIIFTAFVEKQLTGQTQLLDELLKKKDATKLKLKATGMSDADIETLEANLKAGKESATSDITGAAAAFSSNLTTAATGAVSAVDSAVESATGASPTEIVGTLTETVDVEESIKKVGDVVDTISAIVTDTTTSSKVKIDGDVTAEQMQMINLLYEQLRAENTDAEIELTVSKMQNDLWKIEKEIDGLLTSLQQEQLGDLLISLSANPSTVKIKVKYNPGDVSEANGVVVGESDSGLTTAFVIG
ncbi:MAG: DUF5667 domain-containing protein [Nanoarchaeota archaeon]